jgi:hypothetical protein
MGRRTARKRDGPRVHPNGAVDAHPKRHGGAHKPPAGGDRGPAIPRIPVYGIPTGIDHHAPRGRPLVSGFFHDPERTHRRGMTAGAAGHIGPTSWLAAAADPGFLFTEINGHSHRPGQFRPGPFIQNRPCRWLTRTRFNEGQGLHLAARGCQSSNGQGQACSESKLVKAGPDAPDFLHESFLRQDITCWECFFRKRAGGLQEPVGSGNGTSPAPRPVHGN